MHPILIKFGPFTIYSYGMMVALGFGISTFLIYKRATKFNIDKNKILDLAILILLTGLIGARLLYVLLNINYYIANRIEIFNLSKGGLVWYGGFFSSLIISIWYLKKNKINFWEFSDYIAPYIALAQSLGRIGCYLNGCCFGVEASSDFLFGVIFPGTSIVRHPTQIYSSLALLLIFVILRIWQDRNHFNGEIFLGYCILYSLKRFILEFFRGDNPIIAFNLTISQVLSALIFLISILIFIYKAFKWKRVPLRLK